MTLKTVTISITAATSSGTIPTDAVVTFELDGADVDAITGEIVVPDRTSVTLVNGVGSISKWPNARGTGATQYRVTIEGTSYRIAKSITVPDANCDLYSLLQFATVAPAAASAAQIAAQGYAAAASEDSAQTALDRIATTADAAQTAQDRAAAALSAAAAQAAATAQNADMVAAVTTATPTSSSTVLGETAGVARRFAVDKLVPTVSVFRYMTAAQVADVRAGTATENVTDACDAALAAHRAVSFPAGTYLIDPDFRIPASTYIKTDGVKTIFKRDPAAASGASTIVIGGSNIEIETFKVIGDISTGTGEFNHGVQIQAYSTIGDTSNITFHDVYGEDIRGDVIDLECRTGYAASNITIGKVRGDNVLRNVLTIAGGRNIRVAGVSGEDIGLLVVDFEGESYNTTTDGVFIGYIEGKAANCVPSDAASYCDNIHIGTLTVHPTNYGTNSTPAYSSGGMFSTGVNLRNTKNIRFDSYNASGYNSFALAVTHNTGELGCEDIKIGHLNVSNCSITDTTTPWYIDTQNVKRFRCEAAYIDASATTGKRLFYACENLILNNIQAILATNSQLVRGCGNVVINNAVVTGSGTLLLGNTRVVLNNVSHTGESLTDNHVPVVMNNVVATCSGTVFVGSGFDEHYIFNSVINGTAYSVDFDAGTFSVDVTNKRVGIGTASPSHKLDVNSDSMRLRTAKTPASAADTGSAGQICWDTGYMYVCTAANTWKRAAIATW